VITKLSRLEKIRAALPSFAQRVAQLFILDSARLQTHVSAIQTALEGLSRSDKVLLHGERPISVEDLSEQGQNKIRKVITQCVLGKKPSPEQEAAVFVLAQSYPFLVMMVQEIQSASQKERLAPISGLMLTLIRELE
jgi:hypothetical protein